MGGRQCDFFRHVDIAAYLINLPLQQQYEVNNINRRADVSGNDAGALAETALIQYDSISHFFKLCYCRMKNGCCTRNTFELTTHGIFITLASAGISSISQ